MCVECRAVVGGRDREARRNVCASRFPVMGNPVNNCKINRLILLRPCASLCVWGVLASCSKSSTQAAVTSLGGESHVKADG